ncbi:MAG: hypothetical protein M1837_002062 [Sclerophora amabilis]|nr:MAG: hypothetical protein M1837_002062 [Sclerophora amabilis]
MALRLQSNLLDDDETTPYSYGVSRVYSQQVGYVLADAQSTQNNIRTLLKVIRNAEIDPDAGKARPDQLMLQDDPAFVLDCALPALDLDFSNLELSSSASQQSILPSPYGPRHALSGQGDDDLSLIGLNIPTSDSGRTSFGGGFMVAGLEGSSAQRESRFGVRGGIPEEEEEGFLPDVDFEFDAEGNLRDVAVETRREEAAARELATPRRRLDRDSSVGAQVRQEGHEGGQRLGLAHGQPLDLNYDMQMGDDYVLPEAEPFPEMPTAAAAAAAAAATTGHQGVGAAQTEREELSSESAEAPLQRKRKAPKVLEMDLVTELRNVDLAAWNDDYVESMTSLSRKKQVHKAPGLAKKNAIFWVLNSGIGGVGAGIGQSKLPGPLKMFFGPRLLESFSLDARGTAERKRERSEEGESETESEGRRVRARGDDGEHLGRGEEMELGEDDVGRMGEDDGIEVGRQASRELQDFSSAMPWNISSSLRGSRQGSVVSRGAPLMSGGLGGFPTSAGGAGGGRTSLRGMMDPSGLSRRRSRLTSPSPLGARGRYSGFERLSSLEIAENEDEEDEDAFLGGGGGGGGLDSDRTLGDFELQPHARELDTGTAASAAHTQTQTQTQTQATQDILSQESSNFLEFLKAATATASNQPEGEEQAAFPSIQGERNGHVAFSELLPPAENSTMVAAQGFFHALHLATKNLITIWQADDQDGGGAGDIWMRPIITTPLEG